MLKVIKKYQWNYPLQLWGKNYTQSAFFALYQAPNNHKLHIKDLHDDIVYYGDGITILTHTLIAVHVPFTDKIIHLARVDTAQGETALDRSIKQLGY